VADEHRIFTSIDELKAAVGEHLGYSEWITVDQARIDTFADATGDHQWIHVDPERAATGPYGSTIAHGYLTLSLVPVLVASVVEYAGWTVKINYGTNKVRFPSPVPVGSRLRAGVELLAVDDSAGGAAVTSKVTVTAEAPDGTMNPKPALVAEVVTLLSAPLSR
jgi:acyl dehydratase